MRRLLLAAALIAVTSCGTLSAPLLNSRMITAAQEAGVVSPWGDYVVPGDSHEKYIPKIIKWFEARGYKVMLKGIQDICKECYGLTNTNLKIVLIEIDHPANTHFSTLLHEAAHVLFMGKSDSRGVHEAVAEMSAYLAAQKVGLNTQRQSYNYLAGADAIWRDAIYEKFGKEIEKIVRELERAMK
jgi:hypothetical protein